MPIRIVCDKDVGTCYHAHEYPEIKELCNSNDGTNISCQVSIIRCGYDMPCGGVGYYWHGPSKGYRVPIPPEHESVEFTATITADVDEPIFTNIVSLANKLYVRNSCGGIGSPMSLWSIDQIEEYVPVTRYRVARKKPIFDPLLSLFKEHGIVTPGELRSSQSMIGDGSPSTNLNNELELAKYVLDNDAYTYNPDFVDVSQWSTEPPPPIEGDVVDVESYTCSAPQYTNQYKLTFTTLVCDIERNKDTLMLLFQLIDDFCARN
jgi:hypothetical protein